MIPCGNTGLHAAGWCRITSGVINDLHHDITPQKKGREPFLPELLTASGMVLMLLLPTGAAVYLSVSQDGWERRNLWWRWSSSNTQDLRRRSDVPLCSRHHWISHSLTTTTTQTSEHWERPDRTAHHLAVIQCNPEHCFTGKHQDGNNNNNNEQPVMCGGPYLFGLFLQHCSPQWPRSGKQRAKRRRFCRAGGPSWPTSWFAD